MSKFAKWISCDVAPNGTEKFSVGQRVWAELTRSRVGFVAQVGGWSSHDRAHILSLWNNETDYKRFMADDHDDIGSLAAQSDVINSLEVATGTVWFLIGDRYLVASLWSSHDAHDRYARDCVGALRLSADADVDLQSMSGLVVALDGRWTATGSGPSVGGIQNVDPNS